MTRFTKQLAGIQDFLLGSREVEQERAGQTVTVTGVSAQTIPFDEAEGPSIAEQFGSSTKTFTPWQPEVIGTGIDLPNVIDMFGSSDPVTLTGSTVRMERTGFPSAQDAYLVNGLKSDSINFGDTTSLYYKVKSSLDVGEAASLYYIGFANSAFDSWASAGASILGGTLSLGRIGEQMGSDDSTEFNPPIEVSVTDDSEYCVSYDKALNKITFFVDGVEIASHTFATDFGFDVVTGSVYATAANYQGDPSTLTLWSETEFLSDPMHPIAGLEPLIIGTGNSVIDESKYPEKPEGKGYEIVGLAAPAYWNALGKEVKNGDFIVFDNAGLPRTLGEDVDLSDYAKKSELADVAFSGKASDLENDAGFLTTQGLDDFAMGVEDVEIGGTPIGYEGMITYDKFPDHAFGILKSKSLNEVNYEQSLLVINDNNQYHSIGTRIVNADLQTITGVELGINRNTPEMNGNFASLEAMSNPNNLGFASITAVNTWDTTNSNEIVESGIRATGLSFTFNGFNVSHFVDVPASSSATGIKGQLAADADFLHYCYAPNSWAFIPKDAASDGKTYARKDGTWVEVDKSLPINWLVVTTSTFLIEPEHAGKSLWVTDNCVITVSAHNTLPNGFNCEILKADSSLIVSVVTSGGDTIRDGKSVIESDASVFKSPSAGVIGLVGGVL